MVESDDITDAVIKSITGIFILMLVITGLLSYLISKHLLQPFHKTLKSIRTFNLRQKEPLKLAPTRTSELRKLKIGRASCRERVCKYVYSSVCAVTYKKKQT